jgi:hypothetical protein
MIIGVSAKRGEISEISELKKNYKVTHDCLKLGKENLEIISYIHWQKQQRCLDS